MTILILFALLATMTQAVPTATNNNATPISTATTTTTVPTATTTTHTSKCQKDEFAFYYYKNKEYSCVKKKRQFCKQVTCPIGFILRTDIGEKQCGYSKNGQCNLTRNSADLELCCEPGIYYFVQEGKCNMPGETEHSFTHLSQNQSECNQAAKILHLKARNSIWDNSWNPYTPYCHLEKDYSLNPILKYNIAFGFKRRDWLLDGAECFGWRGCICKKAIQRKKVTKYYLDKTSEIACRGQWNKWYPADESIKTLEECKKAAKSLNFGNISNTVQTSNWKNKYVPQYCSIKLINSFMYPNGKNQINYDGGSVPRYFYEPSSCDYRQPCICKKSEYIQSDYILKTSGVCSDMIDYGVITKKDECKKAANLLRVYPKYQKDIFTSQFVDNDPKYCFLDGNSSGVYLNNGSEVKLGKMIGKCSSLKPCICKKIKTKYLVKTSGDSCGSTPGYTNINDLEECHQLYKSKYMTNKNGESIWWSTERLPNNPRAPIYPGPIQSPSGCVLAEFKSGPALLYNNYGRNFGKCSHKFRCICKTDGSDTVSEQTENKTKSANYWPYIVGSSIAVFVLLFAVCILYKCRNKRVQLLQQQQDVPCGEISINDTEIDEDSCNSNELEANTDHYVNEGKPFSNIIVVETDTGNE